MTFDEIQKTLEQMLAVQRNLQEGQLKLQEGQLKLQESQLKLEESQLKLEANQVQLQEGQLQQKLVLDELIQRYGNLAENSIRQKQILDQLIGYSLSNESEHLDLEERLRALETKFKRLENPS